MNYVSIFVLIVACLCVLADAQLTFTSSWGGGKRGAVAATMSCRSEETIAAIYKLIQNEAERLLLCQKP
uniref:Adipokinetic prohormone type 1 n=1 Tax=Agrotis ipsilon TaxID=56364 RepID=AKH1A_AGRIP|nr:RecName: Full=Adipokinetic prohormone type 1; Contains: RecName: Full=Adipokinetic hormone 1; Short=AKH-1; Flags: Precursor [Agrotis ipsilon]